MRNILAELPFTLRTSTGRTMTINKGKDREAAEVNVCGNFDIAIAIEDGGICERQTVDCSSCHIGESLKRRKDELCPREAVLQAALLVKKFL